MNRPPKVCYLEIALQPEQQVLGLDVPVDHVLGVAVLERLGELPDVGCGPGLVEPGAGGERLVQLALWCVLQDQVDACGIIEVGVEPQDVWMPQVALVLDLAAELVFDVRLLELALEQNLERDYELCLLLPGKVDVAELAPAQGLANLEVGELPLLVLWLVAAGLRLERRGGDLSSDVGVVAALGESSLDRGRLAQLEERLQKL